MKLNVNEIYGAVQQGEGKSSGKDVSFLRLAGCNLACTWCLPGTTWVEVPKGKRKQIKDFRVGDAIVSFDGTSFVADEVAAIMSREAPTSDVYRVETEKGLIFATKEHPFFVKGKWINTKDLKEGDELYNIPTSSLVSWKMKGDKNPVHDVPREQLVQRAKDIFTGKVFSKEHRKKISDYKKAHNPMKNPLVVLKNANSHNRAVSSIEEFLISLAQKYSLPIDYVGDNKLWIGDKILGFKNPDFRIKGQQKVIEMYSPTYLYSQGKRDASWENTRREFFASFGYECLFIPMDRFPRKKEDQLILVGIIQKFIMNGDPIVSIRKITPKEAARLGSGFHGKGGKKELVEVFNLTVKNNHNYFANHFLTHNCDTPYTWNWMGTKFEHPDKFDPSKEVHFMETSEIKAELDKIGVKAVVVSGGEPMLQQKALLPLIKSLKEDGYWVEIETNGTIAPIPEFLETIDQVNCSPKLSNSGKDNRPEMRERPIALTILAASPKTSFKWVVTSDKDLEEVEALISKYGMKENFLMPEGKTRAEQLARQDKVKKLCEERGFHFSPRLHILQNDTKRKG